MAGWAPLWIGGAVLESNESISVQYFTSNHFRDEMAVRTSSARLSEPDEYLQKKAQLAEYARKAVIRRQGLPRCTLVREPPGKPPRVCKHRTTQGEVERKRAIYWCAKCGRYPWGKGFGPDDVPEDAWPA